MTIEREYFKPAEELADGCGIAPVYWRERLEGGWGVTLTHSLDEWHVAGPYAVDGRRDPYGDEGGFDQPGEEFSNGDEAPARELFQWRCKLMHEREPLDPEG